MDVIREVKKRASQSESGRSKTCCWKFEVAAWTLNTKSPRSSETVTLDVEAPETFDSVMDKTAQL